jgi:hypothetical protein
MRKDLYSFDSIEADPASTDSRASRLFLVLTLVSLVLIAALLVEAISPGTLTSAVLAGSPVSGPNIPH